MAHPRSGITGIPEEGQPLVNRLQIARRQIGISPGHF
jgi:hypothetical protein